MNTKTLPEWYNPQKELERILAIEEQCLKTIEKIEPKYFKKYYCSYTSRFAQNHVREKNVSYEMC